MLVRHCVLCIRNFAKHHADQGVLHQRQLYGLVLAYLFHRKEQSHKRTEYVPVHVVALKGPHLFRRQRHPVEPPSVLHVHFRVAHRAAIFLLLHKEHALAVRFPRHRPGLSHKDIDVGFEQVSELPPVRSRLHKVHHVERHGVLAHVVEPHDLAPVGRQLLHRRAKHPVVALVYGDARMVKRFPVLQYLPRDHVRVHLRFHRKPYLLGHLPFPHELRVFHRVLVHAQWIHIVPASQDILRGLPKFEQRIRAVLQGMHRFPQRFLAEVGILQHVRDLVFIVIYRYRRDVLYPVVVCVRVAVDGGEIHGVVYAVRVHLLKALGNAPRLGKQVRVSHIIT